MRSVPRLAIAAAAVLSFLAAFGPEPVVRRDLVSSEGTARYAIGAVRLPVFSAAWAQGTAAASLEDVTVTFGPTTYTIPRIDFTGVSLSEADLRALFAGTSAEPLGVRLERLTAKGISIPEVTAETRVGPSTSRQVFRNVVASDMDRGRIARFSGAGSTTEMSGPGGSTTSVEEDITGSELDLAAYVRIFTQKRGQQPEPVTKVLGAYSVERSSLEDGKGVKARIGLIRMRDIAIAPTEESWAAAVSMFTALAEIDQPSEQDIKRALLLMADAFESSELGSVEIKGLEVNLPAPNGAALVGVKRAAYSGARQGQPAETRLEGLELRAPEGSMKLETFSHAGFSLVPSIEGLRALKDKPFEDFDQATARSLIPVLGTVRFAGLSFDFEVPQEGGKGSERLKATVGEFELTADKPLNGIPTNVRLAVRNLGFPLPKDGDEGLKKLLELGYKTVDLSYALSVAWNEAGNEIVLSDVSLGGVEMGRVSLQGVLGGATRALFDPDPAVATETALSTTALSAELALENGGIFERHLRREAQKRKKTPDAVRSEYAAAAALMIPVVLGNSKQAKTLGEAVARFLANPTRLRITARSIDPNGLGLAEIAGMASPAALLEKLDITAAVDERR